MFNKLFTRHIDPIADEIAHLRHATCDPRGIGMAEYMLYNLFDTNIEAKKNFSHLFYDMPKGATIIDCGAHTGRFIDTAVFISTLLHVAPCQIVAYEPNPALANVLANKYAGNTHIEINETAVSHETGKANFQSKLPNDDTPALCDNGLYQAKTLRLADKILASKSDIYLLKLDIEGAEFFVLPDLIKTGAYKKIKHIVVKLYPDHIPTHAPSLHDLESLIIENAVTNIDPNWL